MWNQFADGQEGGVTSDAEGVAINVGTQTGELWQPQVTVLNEGLTLVEDGNYKVVVTYNGDANHFESSSNSNIVISKATPKLTAKKATFKAKKKTKKYSIILKDNKNKALSKVKVTLKVKGKTYKATTNSKGKATFKITKLNKKGTFTAKISFKGNAYYKSCGKTIKIKIK